MKQTDPHFKLRLPPELKASLEKAAGENQRSMSAEMVARLKDSFLRDEPGSHLYVDPSMSGFSLDIVPRDTARRPEDFVAHLGRLNSEIAHIIEGMKTLKGPSIAEIQAHSSGKDFKSTDLASVPETEGRAKRAGAK